MKKGVFGSWFKELATLIFTQTIQAFLLAIVMTVIISALSVSTGTNASFAAGLLAIIALSQFGKIELLVKNIFGVTSQYNVGMDAGKSGVLGGLMTFKAGKRILDNGGKIVGGAVESHKQSLRIKDLEKQKSEIKGQRDASTALEEMDEATDEFLGNASKGAGMALGAQAVGGSGGSTSSGTGVSSNQIEQLIAAVKNQTEVIKQSGKGGSGSGKDPKDKIASRDTEMDAIDKQIDEAKLQRRLSRGKMVSGFTETAGAMVGGAVAGISSLGMGDSGSEILHNTVMGAGVGDMIGAAPASAVGKVDSTRTQFKQIKQDISRKEDVINQNKNKQKMYEDVKSRLNNIKDNHPNIYNNASQKAKRKTVDNIKKSAKAKYDASNM